jgi:Fis family transcriptional regulator, factor for inversion stimulation protein
MNSSVQPVQEITCEAAAAIAPFRLSEYVRAALDAYFANVGTEEAGNVYELVIAEVERPLLACVLEHCGGNQTRAAHLLGLNRATLRKKLRVHDLL